jgi:hypothetical protein
MSNFDRYASPRPGAGYARSGVAVDQGLRAYMIGVYNYMTLGLGVTGLVAWGAFQLGTQQLGDGRLGLTDFGHAIYVSPLWCSGSRPGSIRCPSRRRATPSSPSRR